MTSFERPPPDPAKIVDVWRAWREAPETLPGRTMADLKIGGLDKVLETVTSSADQVADSLVIWQRWESGKLGPHDALAQLTDAGLDDVIAALAEVT